MNSSTNAPMPFSAHGAGRTPAHHAQKPNPLAQTISEVELHATIQSQIDFWTKLANELEEQGRDTLSADAEVVAVAASRVLHKLSGQCVSAAL